MMAVDEGESAESLIIYDTVAKIIQERPELLFGHRLTGKVVGRRCLRVFHRKIVGSRLMEVKTWQTSGEC